jgi:ATP-dependent protease HslVU (ClpYQ) ATPase subunit
MIIFVPSNFRSPLTLEKRSRGCRGSADASAEGVQRDLLPIIEGCTVNTKVRWLSLAG